MGSDPYMQNAHPEESANLWTDLVWSSRSPGPNRPVLIARS